MHPLETYLHALHQDRSFGEAVDETSYYGHLQTLLNEVGKSLKPRVQCVMQLRNRGAGHPDGGLFTADQRIDRKAKAQDLPLFGQVPARGVIEVKGASDDAWLTADGAQVTKYWEKYQQVLVTNYRDFVLVGRGESGKPEKLESFSLAESEQDFWRSAAHPRAAAERVGDAFADFLKRILLNAAQLTSPEQVAFFLASYAHEALRRIEKAELEALAQLRQAIEEALGTKFVDEKGEHFFRSTLVQTLFYGLFSAWVLWHRVRTRRPDERFTWHGAAYNMGVPFISALFRQLESPALLKPIKLDDVMDWATAALNRVVPGEFFQRFQEEHAVQYFYEPFLEAFDPQLRKDYGVWYTPPEIVTYMVERVDRVLRSELGLPDGLADPNVVVLDPCCGTGAYLVEVLERIHRTLEAKGGDALIRQDLKKAARERVFGFEIMPAPFVVAHLQMGLRLARLGVPLDEQEGERAAIYLTNALTGWEPPKGPKKQLMLPEMEDERDLAEQVKQEARILVVLGNPPYNAFAGTSPDEEQGLVGPYKDGLVKEWKIKKFNLDDLYVRFFRLAERRIAEMSKRGVVCFISNFSYLGDPSFVVMRKRFLDEFDALWLDCLNGDSRETGKLTPEGEPDPSVFSTEHNREGIRVGTAVGLLVKREADGGSKPVVRFRHYWGVSKRADLLASLQQGDFDAHYETAKPKKENRYSFRPSKTSKAYDSWPKITELSGVAPYNGPVERRGLALISIDKEALQFRMQQYFTQAISNEEIARIHPSLMMTGNRIVGPEARKKILESSNFDASKIVRYPFKPMDVRWCYLDNIRPLFSEPSPDLIQQAGIENGFLITRDTADKDPEGPPFVYSLRIGDYDCISGHARHFPSLFNSHSMRLGKHEPNQTDLGISKLFEINRSVEMRAYLHGLKVLDNSQSLQEAARIWLHVLAIGYSPAYLTENADGIRQNWPRIPLPDSRERLEGSAALGRRIADLLDVDQPVPGVSSDPVRPELKAIGSIQAVNENWQGEGDDLAITVGWGHAGKDNATMPGKGKAEEREYTAQERAAIEAGAKALGISAREAFARLGKTTRDVYLNGGAYWRNIPSGVWDYYIGGYQVIKKWLSYRERDLLGRPLTMDEARYVTEMARRIAAIVLLGPELDENYRQVKAHAYPWPG